MLELIFIFLLGAACGSFANVLILRVPQGNSVVSPPSSCLHCGNKIPFYHNIPILSYLFLRGKSACCQTSISPIYLMGEIIGAFLFAAVFLKEGVSVDFLRIAVVLLLLYVLSMIDLKEMMIPDSISLSAALISIMSIHMDVLQSFFILAGFGAMLKIFVSFVVKKEAMGEGDIIIFAILGALLGIKGAFFAIFLASVIALPIFSLIGRESRVAFVPFLALGGLITYLFNEPIHLFLVGIYG